MTAIGGHSWIAQRAGRLCKFVRLYARLTAAARNGHHQNDIPSDNLGRKVVALNFGFSPRPYVRIYNRRTPCGAALQRRNSFAPAEARRGESRRGDLSSPVTGQKMRDKS